MSTTYQNSTVTTGGVNTLTQAGVPGVVWNLTFLDISFAGPSYGPNAQLTIYDGSAATGTVIFREYLNQPTGSVGLSAKINLPVDAKDNLGLQALPGNAMTIVVDGFGANRCSINARFTDGLP